MYAIELTAPSLSSFRRTIRPEPAPGAGEVLVKMRAASLNYIDIAVATGHYPVDSFPLLPVCDGAGEVAAIGPGVDGLTVGQRVIPHSKPLWVAGAIEAVNSTVMRGITLPGSVAEYVVLPASALVPTPAHLSDIEAATLPIAATTAWNALRAARVRPGSVVVLLGTGGVSIFALQLAKAAGATVILTSSSEEKLERAKRLGADLTINYRSMPAWDQEVLALTQGRGADLVLETVGPETFPRSLNAVAYGGTVFVIGFVSGTRGEVDLLPIIVKALNLQGNNTGSVADLRDAARAIGAAGIRPVIDRTFAIDETAQAYARLANGGQHFGKIAIAH
ncbi:MAG: NAD(P)-dependent alcohol dehydrogenase [Steroidobacteraceae bacterium]